MKKILVFFAVLIIISACNGANSNNSNGENDSIGSLDSFAVEKNFEELSFDSVHWIDSVVLDSNSKVLVEYNFSYPKTGIQELKDSINTWICMLYGDSTLQYLNDIPSYVSKIAKSKLKYMTDDAKMEYEDRLLSDWHVNREENCNIGVLYEDSDYITMQDESYEYYGGAHGMYGTEAVTFSKKDGHRLGWELLKDMPEKEILKEIRKQLPEYLGISPSELDEHLLVTEIELPATPPYLTKEGVTLIYQLYEITPYCDGTPIIIIKRQK